MTQSREDLFKTVYDYYFIEHLHTIPYLQYVISECERIGCKFVWKKPFTVHLEGDLVYVPPCIMKWMHRWYNPENIEDRMEWLLNVSVLIKDTDAGPKCYMNQTLAEEVRDAFDYVIERLQGLERLQRERIEKAQK